MAGFKGLSNAEAAALKKQKEEREAYELARRSWRPPCAMGTRDRCHWPECGCGDDYADDYRYEDE